MRQNSLLLSFVVTLVAIAYGSAALAADALHDAKKRVSDAQTELTKAKVAVSLAAKKIQKQLEASPEWKQAAAAEREATNRYEATTKAARERLAKQPAYKAAAAELNKRMAERDALRAKPKAPPSEDGTNGAAQKESADPVVVASVAVLNAQTVLRKLEQQAYVADPDVTKARSDLDDATAKLVELKRSFLEKVKDDPAFQAAQQQLQQANTNYAQASKELADARKQQAAAEDQKLDRDLDTQRQQMFDRAGFRR